MTAVEKLGAAAKAAERSLSIANTETKNLALIKISEKLREKAEAIISANGQDMKNAEINGLKTAFMDRLLLTPSRIEEMAKGVDEVRELPDPIGRVLTEEIRPSGLKISKKSVPLGVIGIIFESRPNVTVDAAVLCLKSGNACILRGGKEAINSNTILVDIMREAINEAGLPADCVCLVTDTSRDSANELMCLRDYLNILIPRGGAGLIKAVVENAKVPVIETGKGNCHAYVDAAADLKMAADIVYNAKCSRPSVCNAIETLLVHRDVSEIFLPMAAKLLDEENVQLRCDAEALKILGNSAVEATQEDWVTEFDDYILAVKVVGSLDEALEHINKYSTNHSEVIITGNAANAERFLNEVDSAAVYVNASTRFTDGGEFGLGAEIGISTQKVHARGPMGLREMTSYKYVVEGSGQIR